MKGLPIDGVLVEPGIYGISIFSFQVTLWTSWRLLIRASTSSCTVRWAASSGARSRSSSVRAGWTNGCRCRSTTAKGGWAEVAAWAATADMDGSGCCTRMPLARAWPSISGWRPKWQMCSRRAAAGRRCQPQPAEQLHRWLWPWQPLMLMDVRLPPMLLFPLTTSAWSRSYICSPVKGGLRYPVASIEGGAVGVAPSASGPRRTGWESCVTRKLEKRSNPPNRI